MEDSESELEGVVYFSSVKVSAIGSQKSVLKMRESIMGINRFCGETDDTGRRKPVSHSSRGSQLCLTRRHIWDSRAHPRTLLVLVLFVYHD